MSGTSFPHIMGNVLWSYNGWTAIDAAQIGKSQFSHTREHPDNHGDATLFNWKALLLDKTAYVPFMNIPRAYTEKNNGQGILFIVSREPKEKKYYIVGFFSRAKFDLDYPGTFSCKASNSVRFGRFIPYDVERHCPLTKDGIPRKQRVGENNFNYISDEWARAILQDAAQAHQDGSYSSRGCSVLLRNPLTVIREVHRTYFGELN